MKVETVYTYSEWCKLVDRHGKEILKRYLKRKAKKLIRFSFRLFTIYLLYALFYAIMINYIAAMVDISQKRKKLKDKKELEQLILSHMQFTDLAGIADDSLQETMDLLYGRSTNIWSSSPIEKESQDNENKKSKLKENLQKTDRALERLKKAYLFDDDAMDEKEFLEMKSKLEIDRVKIENEIKDIDNDAIANNVNQIDFIKTASQFLIIHKINSGEFIDYRSLAILDEESMKAFMNSVIDHIVVLNRQITEIVFKNGLSHKLLYR